VWHELVLHGIGGRTVEEARERMSHTEFVRWCSYIRKHGTLNVGLRVEMAAALVSHVVSAVNGNKTRIQDFLPKREPQQASIQDVFKMIKSTKKGG
jgi:hypothetical protein